jgi:3-hydroxyisobutyrate dehydrogenase-like beta-hydroxyacid dehydrogenase
MTAPILGFIGFGEAASSIAEGLRSEGLADIRAFDAGTDHPSLGPLIRERAERTGVELKSALEELIASCDLIINATNAKAAEAVAREAARFLRPHQLYVDLNSASPMTKESIAALIAGSGAPFVDAAVMESVPPHRHKVPMLVSGSGAEAFLGFGEKYGMKLTYAGPRAGGSSALKMFRSVFMKGFSMLLLETLQASEKYGVSSDILASLEQTLRQRSLEEAAHFLLTRSAIHAERRVAEMDEVLKTLEALGIPTQMSHATKAKLQALADAGLKDRIDPGAPPDFRSVLRELE